MTIFLSRPKEVEAFKWTGGPDQEPEPLWFTEAMQKGEVIIHRTEKLPIMVIGNSDVANINDYIVCEDGFIYAFTEEAFNKSFESKVDTDELASLLGDDDCEGCKI